MKVFRSLIQDTRITAAGVEFEMYVQPTKNVWWKYRQQYRRQSARKRLAVPPIQTVRLEIPQAHSLATRVYTAPQVAKMLGISVDLLRLRIKQGKYPTPSRSEGNRRLFTNEHIRQIQSIR